MRKKEKRLEAFHKDLNNEHAPGEQVLGGSFVRRKSSQIRKMLPKSPRKAISIVKHLWNQLYKSPRKRKVIDEMWCKDKQMGKYMYFLGKYKNKKNEHKLNQTVTQLKKKYKSLRNACRETDLHWSQFHSHTRLYKRKIESRKYIRKLNAVDIESIGKFFKSEDISFPLPDKKYSGQWFMKGSLAKSCKMYNLLTTTTRKICETTFRKYKPRFVKLQGKIPLRQSCCEVCQNFEYVMKSASKFLKGVPSSIDACVDSSMCSYESYFPKINCALCKCLNCGVEKLKLKLIDMNAHLIEDERKRFLIKRWETKRESLGDKYRTYMHWKHDRLSYRELLHRYVNDLKGMASHCFFAAWNFHQYLVCKNNLEKGQIVIVHDYAQNYLCIHQHEIQAMHWCHKQVTMHPSCISYRCPVDNCNQMVLHEIVHISDDLKHDGHLVRKFQQCNLQILNRRGVEIRKIIEFTDQAPSQYKNKTAFRYLCQEKIPTERNFFGVRHGKGPCDACAGRIKGRLAKLVKTESAVVNTARSCFDACKEFFETRWPDKDECCHYILTFNYVGKLGKRPDTSKWKGVAQTREHMHSIMNRGDELKVNVRDVVCLCTGCLHGDSTCKNSKWRGFDMASGKEVDVDLGFWNSVVICKTVGSREDYEWEDVRAIIDSYTNYNDLQEYVKRNPLPFFDCHIDLVLSAHDRDNIDNVALHYLPTDAPEGFVPCRIGSDGNCFPRTLSYICFRNQRMHIEFRVRLLYEAILNAKQYVNNRYLSKGCNIVYRRGGPVKQIAMYSESYNPGEELDVVELYKKEVMKIAHDGNYCGLWQLCQAANILRRPVLSVYPTEFHEGMRLEFNRTFYCIDSKYNDREPIVVMWTPMQVAKNSYPVHFVPLLKAVSL